MHHANENSFADFKRITSGLDIPFYCVPGNHDVGMVPDDTTLAFYRSTMGEDYFSFKHKGVSFIFTNSQLWKTDIGEESKEHDLWFNKTLTNENGSRVLAQEITTNMSKVKGIILRYFFMSDLLMMSLLACGER